MYCIGAEFLQTPTRTLYDVLQMAAGLERHALKLRTLQPFSADEIRIGSNRLQLAAAACLRSIGAQKDGLGRFEVDELLRAPMGAEALKLALFHRCRGFVAKIEIQSFMQREWHGKLLSDIVDERKEPRHRLHSAACFSVALLLNLGLLPIVALLPQTETRVYLWCACPKPTPAAIHPHGLLKPVLAPTSLQALCVGPHSQGAVPAGACEPRALCDVVGHVPAAHPVVQVHTAPAL